MKRERLWNAPVTLEGNVVRLEPLAQSHIPGLAEAGKDDSIWEYMVYGNVTSASQMAVWVGELLQSQETGTDLPFAVIFRESGQVVGATRFLEMRPRHHSLEIGGTWYALEFQRTAVNTECKYLMLKYAFEELDCIRVQFKADSRNERSLRAIERLGAVHEGTLRNHMILPDGRIRDSVYFSILALEWPEIKVGLENKLGR